MYCSERMNIYTPIHSESEPLRAVSVFALHADAVREMDWEPVQRRLPGRIEMANRYRFERDKLLCIGAGLLLLKAVGIRDETELRYGEYGRPFAPGYPDFNLSHSGEWCVLAVGEKQIGVDIERVDSANLHVAPMVYTAAELAWMEESPLERFHVLWTLKESVMKATGQGMNLGPESFEVLPFCFGASVALRGCIWHASHGALGEYRYSVCASYPMKVDLVQVAP